MPCMSRWGAERAASRSRDAVKNGRWPAGSGREIKPKRQGRSRLNVDYALKTDRARGGGNGRPVALSMRHATIWFLPNFDNQAHLHRNAAIESGRISCAQGMEPDHQVRVYSGDGMKFSNQTGTSPV